MFLAESDASLRQWRVYKDEIKFPYEVLPSWRQRFGRYNILLNRGVRSALNKIRPDAVSCGGYNYLASWESAGWARVHRVPLLLWSESTALDKRRRYPAVEFMKRRFLSLCQAFVVPGRSAFEYLKDLGIPDERIFTAPNAVDIQLFAAWRMRRGGKNRRCAPASLCLCDTFFVLAGWCGPREFLNLWKHMPNWILRFAPKLG